MTASETLMAFRWRTDHGSTLNAGLIAWGPDQNCLESLYFIIFQRGPDPLSALLIRSCTQFRDIHCEFTTSQRISNTLLIRKDRKLRDAGCVSRQNCDISLL